MSYELISSVDYDSLPDDDDQCFVQFESICRRNMTRMIDENTSPEFDHSVREQYMAAVAAIAQECHILNLTYSCSNPSNFYETYGKFSLAVQGEVARIRVRSRGMRHPYSVLLTGSTRTKIEHYVCRLRDLVERSDFESSRKKRLQSRLDQFSAEMDNARLSFAKTTALLVSVLAGIGSSVTIAADGQSAVAHIMLLIGHDKATEDAAAQRLTHTQRALPSPSTNGHAVQRNITPETVAETDNEIPF